MSVSINVNEKWIIFLDTVASFLFFLYVFMMTTANHTVYFQITMFLFVFVVALWMIASKSIYFSGYFAIMVVFIAYHYYLIQFGIAVYPDISFDMVQTLVIGWIAHLVTYNFVLVKNNFKRILELFVYGSFAGTISLFIIGWRTVLEGRFLYSTDKFMFLGVSVSGSSNYTGFICAIAFLMAMVSWIKEKKSKFIYLGGLFASTVFLTGSRKSLALMVIASILLLYKMYPKEKIRNVLLSIVVLCVTYFLITDIPVLYDIMGSRIESALNFFNTGETSEGSIYARYRFIELGMHYFYLQPINGYGLDSFRFLNDGIYSHNNYVEMLVSGGVIGAFLFYSTYLYTLVKVAIASKKAEIQEIRMILNMFIIMIIMKAFLEYWMVVYEEKMFALIFVLALACAKTILNREFQTAKSNL